MSKHIFKYKKDAWKMESGQGKSTVYLKVLEVRF